MILTLLDKHKLEKKKTMSSMKGKVFLSFGVETEPRIAERERWNYQRLFIGRERKREE
jgi:hypothetical protein